MMDRYQFEFLSYLGKNKEVVLNYKKIADKVDCKINPNAVRTADCKI
ncbi:hypothetical protein LASHA2_03990 [Lactiplantibacillus plantarum]